MYIEIKARTWSLSDAENKATLICEMMDILGINVTETLKLDYLEMATD